MRKFLVILVAVFGILFVSCSQQTQALSDKEIEIIEISSEIDRLEIEEEKAREEYIKKEEEMMELNRLAFNDPSYKEQYRQSIYDCIDLQQKWDSIRIKLYSLRKDRERLLEENEIEKLKSVELKYN